MTITHVDKIIFQDYISCRTGDIVREVKTLKEEGYDLAFDPTGYPVVTGDTASPGFPTTAGAYNEHHNKPEKNPKGKKHEFSSYRQVGEEDDIYEFFKHVVYIFFC